MRNTQLAAAGLLLSVLVACGLAEAEAPGPGPGFVGRFDMRNPEAPEAAWPGTQIIVRFEGTDVAVNLDEIFDGDDEGPSEWDVVIDGRIDKKLVLETGEHDYELAKGLEAGIHVVELYKRSEAQNGVTRFLGFDLNGGRLLAPPDRPQRRIEVIGDSEGAGYGIEGVGMGPDCPGAGGGAKYQNFHRSFPANLGRMLAADVHGTVFSGKGFAQNYWRPDKVTLGKIYPLANPMDPESRYDLESWVPDVVVIVAGDNDFAIGEPEDDGPVSFDEFKSAYAALVATVRNAYPRAHIFLVLPPSVNDDAYKGRKTRTNIKRAITAIAADRRHRATSAATRWTHPSRPPRSFKPVTTMARPSSTSAWPTTSRS